MTVRRTPLVAKLFLAVAVIACAGLGFALFQTAANGNNWRSKAEASAGDLQAAQDAVDIAEDLLAASEADVARLERRVNDLANEKAVAQDEAASAAVGAAALLELTQYAVDVTEWATACIDYQEEWRDILYNISRGYVYNEYQIDLFIDDMVDTCAEAKYRADDLQAYIASL